MPPAIPAPLALTPDDEESLRQAQLQLLNEFDRICTTHGLTYFALYGTALGAVRHGGFIPWDDDLDVGMLRPDYDRMIEIINADLGDRFFFQTVDTDPAYGCMFGKLRLEGTRCVDRISFGSPQHGGIFVDVFPLDAKASRGRARVEQRMMRYVGFRLLYIKSGYLFMKGTSVASRIIQTVAKSVVALVPRRVIVALTRRHTRLGDAEAPDQYVSLFGAYFYDHDTVDAAWIHPLSSVKFENTTIPVFADTEAYLTQIYGNWSEPPPEADRVGHHEIVELEFEAGDR